MAQKHFSPAILPACNGNQEALQAAGEQTKATQKLLQDNKYRHLLDIHELLRVTGPDNMKAIFSKSPPGCGLRQGIPAKPGVDGTLPGRGPHSGKLPGRHPNSFRYLESRRQKPGLPHLPVSGYGIASVFSTGPFAGKLKANSANCNPVRRYQIFKNCIRKNKLHPGFIKLRPWEIRFVTGIHWDDKL